MARSSMVRRVPMIAALSALVLALSGCLGGGPSNGDVSKVKEALGALGAGWKVVFVDNTRSDSEGIDHYLSIVLHHDARVEPEDLIEVFTILADTLPSSYRYKLGIIITVGEDDAVPNLVEQARDVGLDMGLETFYEDGLIWVRVPEMKRIVEEYPS